MSFSRIQMGEEELFEVSVKDLDGKKLENWRVMKRDFPRVVKILNKKFGLGMIIIDKKRKTDLDWAI